jgi:hypothetical protein
MSQPCSAVELVLFDARDLTSPEIRRDVETVVSLGVLSGAVLNEDQVANVVTQAGFDDQFGFWFGGDGSWPFERALAFANIEPGRTLFVSSDPAACATATSLGIRSHDDRTTDIAALLP